MLEAEVVALGEVEGDNVTIEGLAGGLEGFFVGGPDCEEVAVGLEVADSEVLCGVGENEGCTAEDLDACWHGEGKGRGYR